MTAAIIEGVYEAVRLKQGQYTVNTRIPVYKTELYCMVSMVDLIVTPRLRQGRSTAAYINIRALLSALDPHIFFSTRNPVRVLQL